MKMKILFIVFIGLISFKFILVSCTKDKAPAPIIPTEIVLTAECPDTIFYSTQIKPFIDANCSTSGCHDVTTHAANFDLTTHANVSANIDIIVQSMDPALTNPSMPFGLPVIDQNDSIFKKINCWKGQGKLNN